MKKILSFFLLLLPAIAFSSGIYNPGSGSGGSGTPSAPSDSIQFNNGGSFGGDANATFTTAKGVTISTITVTSSMTVVSQTHRTAPNQTIDLEQWWNTSSQEAGFVNAAGTFNWNGTAAFPTVGAFFMASVNNGNFYRGDPAGSAQAQGYDLFGSKNQWTDSNTYSSSITITSSNGMQVAGPIGIGKTPDTGTSLDIKSAASNARNTIIQIENGAGSFGGLGYDTAAGGKLALYGTGSVLLYANNTSLVGTIGGSGLAMSMPISMGTNQINSMGNGTADTDAIALNQLKTVVSSMSVIGSGLRVPFGVNSGSFTVINSTSNFSISVATSSSANFQFSVSSAIAVNPSDYIFTVSSITGTMALGIQNNGHIISSGTTPAPSSCGVTPVIDGTDNAFTVTPGATAAGCTITFVFPFANNPVCQVKEQTESVVNALSYTHSTTAVTFTQTGAAGVTYDVICIGKKA